jgi:hypothetical protein
MLMGTGAGGDRAGLRVEARGDATAGREDGRAGVDADVTAGHLVEVRVGDFGRFDLGDEVHGRSVLSCEGSRSGDARTPEFRSGESGIDHRRAAH